MHLHKSWPSQHPFVVVVGGGGERGEGRSYLPFFCRQKERLAITDIEGDFISGSFLLGGVKREREARRVRRDAVLSRLRYLRPRARGMVAPRLFLSYLLFLSFSKDKFLTTI